MKLKLNFLVLLCLFFKAGAQEKTIKPGGLRPGDTVPDILITGLSGYKVNGITLREARLSQFKGKLLIMDFWATWCAPCRAMVPVMDSLQKTFKGRVQFLSVSYEPERVTAPVLAQLQKQHPFDLPEVNGDQVLHELFPHQTLPHYVWIDADGKVVAITELKEITAENIRRMLKGPGISLTEKKDEKVAYDPQVPLLLNGNGGDGAPLLYHSVLTRYIPGLSGGTRISKFDPVKGQLFTARNVGLPWLCRMAWNEGGRFFQESCIKVLSKDSAKIVSRASGQAYQDWLAAGNGWCYELLVPPQLATSAFPIIREDLRRMFPQYQITVEAQSARCLALVRTSKEDKLKSRGETPLIKVTPYSAMLTNAPLSAFMLRLQMQYLQNSPLPVIDATGYRLPVDLKIDAPLYDVPALNKALAAYDLALVEKQAVTDMLVIRDAVPTINSIPNQTLKPNP